MQGETQIEIQLLSEFFKSVKNTKRRNGNSSVIYHFVILLRVRAAKHR
jgi:hypothetical protein